MFYWNGITSESKGLVVSKEIRIPKPEKRFEKIDIEGRSGYLTIDKGTYEPILVSVECHIVNQDMTEIFRWLDGYGTFSIDNVYEYEALVVNQIALKKVAQFYNDVLIQFELQPIKKTKTVYEEVVVDTKTFNIDASANMNPTLELEVVGDIEITINGNKFYLYDLNGVTILNSELKTITDITGNISNKMNGNFPILIPGENTISYILGEESSIEHFGVKYRKSYL